MPKRKSSAMEEPAAEAEVTPRRSLRHKSSTAPVSEQFSAPARAPPPQPAPARKGRKAAPNGHGAPKHPPGAKKREAKPKPAAKDTAKEPATNAASAPGPGDDDATSERQYWLMKAEPESRMENGVDVKFSIDDLAAKTAPEPWDGIRAYPARNNLRAMKKGDLAFFYHSNCKTPGIVGTMEIVVEHSPDLSAHDPAAPYYDPSSKPSDPKWSVVHVAFRSKFAVPIGLKELRAMAPLADMQMLRQSRLSVSRVSGDEWDYLMGVAEEKAKAETGEGK